MNLKKQINSYRNRSRLLGEGCDDDSNNACKLKVFVVIANHGTKNRAFCEQMVDEFRSMDRYQCDITVLSDTPKNFSSDITVIVGLPTKDPWSLPYGHKCLFEKFKNEYDLFIYTEDDILISEKNIQAFVEVTQVLPKDLIAGFMRYEIAKNKEKSYPDMHSHFHWDPNSVASYEEFLFAHHTNEHSACFILTREQLRMAIDSGGFMLPPRKGSYDMLVTAATDPYTQCGMKKMICLSKFDEFNIHHLSNAYLGKMGIDANNAELEINHLISLSDEHSNTIRGPLFNSNTLGDRDQRNKKYYEGQRNEILDIVPRDARRVLSVGCGCGTTEAVLVRRGVEVVGVPLDSIIGVSAANKGITILPPDFDLSAEDLDGQKFDVVIMADIIQHIYGPPSIMSCYRNFLQEDGSMIVSIPNCNYIGTLRHSITSYGLSSVFSRVNTSNKVVLRMTKKRVTRWLLQSGFRHINYFWVQGDRFEQLRKMTYGYADELFCRYLLIVAQQ